MTINNFDIALDERSDLKQYGSNARLLFALEMKTSVEDIHAVAVDSLTDGSDDKKCDIIYVSRDEGIVIVAQGFESSNLSKTTAKANKAADLNTAASWLLSRDISELPERIKSAAVQARLALEEGDINTIQFWFVHNLPESENVNSELKTVEETVKCAIERHFPSSEVGEISAIEYGRDRLEELYQTIESPILVNDELSVKVYGGYELPASHWNAFITSVPGSWLYDLHSQYKSRLFSANIRDYLGSRRSDKNINHGIKQTAQQSPEEFWVFNNGITAIVNDLKYNPDDNILKIKGLSIVNGAQTTGAIGTLEKKPSEEVFVPARFIKCNSREIIINIIRYNNSQNSIRPTDFRSNDPVQRRLRDEFSSIPQTTYTGGRRGGPDAIIRRNSDLLPSETCAQALAAFHLDPTIAYNRKSLIWESDSLYSRYFNEQTSAKHIVFVYSLLKSIERFKLNLIKLSKFEQSLSSDQRDYLSFLRKRGAAILFVSAISRCLETILEAV